MVFLYDALKGFKKTTMDYLKINNFLILLMVSFQCYSQDNDGLKLELGAEISASALISNDAEAAFTNSFINNSANSSYASIINTGGFSFNSRINSRISYKNWIVTPFVGLNFSRQKQVLHANSEISPLFSAQLEHHIHLWRAGLQIGRVFNLNSKNAIVVELGYNISGFLNMYMNDDTEKSNVFNATIQQVNESTSIITETPGTGLVYHNYNGKLFFSPDLRLGHQMKLKKNTLLIHFTWQPSAFVYYLNHRIEIEDRTALAYSYFKASSFSLGFTYFINFSK